MRPFFLSLPLILLAAPLQAQPFSQSLMQCATLFETPLRLYPEREGTERHAALEEKTAEYRRGAFQQAKAEGQHDVLDYLDRIEAEAAADWDGRGALFLFSDEAKEWGSYCRKLHRHLDLS